MGQRQIKRALCRLIRIVTIAKPRFLGECIGIEPVNQLLAPAGDDAGLRIMHMRVHKTRADHSLAIVCYRSIGMIRPQGRAIACRGDPPCVDQHPTGTVKCDCIRPIVPQRIA